MENKTGGGISMNSTGGSIFAGPMPGVEGQSVIDARLARIAELEAANEALQRKAKDSADYGIRAGTKLAELQVENAQLKIKIEQQSAELAKK